MKKKESLDQAMQEVMEYSAGEFVNEISQADRIAQLARETSNIIIIDSNEKLEEWLNEEE